MARIVAANWKMNLTASESLTLAESIVPYCKDLKHTEVLLAPSSIAIPAVASVINNSFIKLGSQNVCGEPKGAFTGELSVTMLKDFGCSFAIVGHSERRHVFGESDLAAAKRATGAVQQGLTPIFCIGELLQEREREQTEAVLSRQLNALISMVEPHEFQEIIIAYEPCWAIGTGLVATIEIIEEVHNFIYSTVAEVIAPPKAILYGGSVTPENFGQMLKIKHVDGGLIGGASLRTETLTRLIQIAENTAG